VGGLPDLILFVGVAFALATVVGAGLSVVRRGDSQRIDILLVALFFALVRFLRGPMLPLGLTLQATQPFLLLRLVGHFRAVPVALQVFAAALVPLQIAVLVVWPGARPAFVDGAMSVAETAVLVCAAWAFLRERRLASGVTGRRLAFAAFGTALVAARESLLLWVVVVPSLNQPLSVLTPAITGVFLICFFFAFSPPRALAARWQRAEQARYLTETAERDVEERGATAAADLSEAAAAAVSNAATAVALRDSPSASAPLLVRAATVPALLGVTVGSYDLISRVAGSAIAAAGRVDDCDPALAARLREFGGRVLAAPVAASSHVWGVVFVVQRRGSLFPEDDLQLLAQLGRYAGIALDHARLTADRRERERRDAHRRLREVESRMSLMLDSIKDYALFVINPQGRIVSWEPGAEHVFGYSAAEMRDQPAAPLFNLDAGTFLACLDQARSHDHVEYEGACRHRDGTAFTGTTTIRRLRGDDDLDGFVAVTHDVTAERHLEERLRQSAKLEAVGLLAGGIAHDFNNLLTAIVGYAGLLQASYEPTDPRSEDLEQIQQAAERAAALTHQLLAFSRRQMLQSAVVDLSESVDELLPVLRTVAGDRITVTHVADPVWPITADPSQIDRVLLNLVANARDAMPGGGRLTLRTTNMVLDDSEEGADAAGSFVMLEVSDTGMGMTESTRARIFEPFFTTKPLGRGTGLGLAAVYGVVKQMNGVIRVDSKPGEGATFRLYFPADVRARAAAAVESIRPAPPAVVPEQGALLLVENDPVLRAELRQALELGGFRVLAAEHQASALQLAAACSDPISLVISDPAGGEGSGPNLVETLAKVRPGVPSLLLPKPYSSTELLARVRQILRPIG
jgi:PAS domain S-box-containing protein